MADHVRDQILAGVVELLLGLPTTGDRVARGRTTPFAGEECPALNVRQGPERTESRELGAPRVQERLLQVDVAIHVKQGDSLDAALNAIALEVEQRLAMPACLGVLSMVNDIGLVFTERPRQEQGDKPVAQMVLAYQVRYAVEESAPDVAL